MRFPLSHDAREDMPETHSTPARPALAEQRHAVKNKVRTYASSAGAADASLRGRPRRLGAGSSIGSPSMPIGIPLRLSPSFATLAPIAGGSTMVSKLAGPP